MLMKSGMNLFAPLRKWQCFDEIFRENKSQLRIFELLAWDIFFFSSLFLVTGWLTLGSSFWPLHWEDLAWIICSSSLTLLKFSEFLEWFFLNSYHCLSQGTVSTMYWFPPIFCQVSFPLVPWGRYLFSISIHMMSFLFPSAIQIPILNNMDMLCSPGNGSTNQSTPR